MSRPIPKGGIVRVTPAEKLREFARVYRGAFDPTAAERFAERCVEHGLHFSGDEFAVLVALDTPAKVQEFLNTRIYYNDDHASVEQEETAMPPRRVLHTGMAHCFEGAMFAYAVDFLHGHEPRLVMLEASQDADHNIVVCRDRGTGFYGSNAQSRYPGIVGRPAGFQTVRELAESYVPFYFSDRTLDPKDLTLVGYSDEIDLVAKFGAAWMASLEPLWDIYYTYIDDTCLFHYFTNDPGRPHLYPFVRALRANWIRVDAEKKPYVSADDMPAAARVAWRAFWKAYRSEDGPRPQGKAREVEQEFFRLTGTTPIDLDDNAFDLQSYLAAGHRIEQLLTQRTRRPR